MFSSTRKNTGHEAQQRPYLYKQISESEKRRRDQYTVFLIEDNADDREQILKTLEKSPHIYNVHCFESGDDLVTYFVNEGYYNSPPPPHNMLLLILMDLHLPGISGMEVLRDLREHPMTKHIPIVMITSDTSAKRVEEAYHLHVNGYILKPVHLDNIHDAIQR